MVNTANQYYHGLKGIKLEDRFNEVQEIRPNVDKIKNICNEDKLINLFSIKNNNGKIEIDKINNCFKKKNFNLKDQKKILFNDINDDDYSYSKKENINKNNISIFF